MASGPQVRFRFGRSVRSARAGEALLGALGRHGWPSLSRSIRYHRPRGPFCGVGDCTQCLVRVNGVPNVRSCRYRVAEGDAVRTENSWPSPRFDVLAALDLLLPHGVDTVHGLRRPAWASKVYQTVGRSLAGFGRAPDRPPAPYVRPLRSTTAEVVIVGEGRTGREVEEVLVRQGACPLVLERRRPTLIRGRPAPSSTVERLNGVTATILPPPAPAAGVDPGRPLALLGIDENGGGVVVHARAVVLATGAYDGALVFEGSDRPGVVTADLALSELDLPLGPCVVVGGGARARQVVDRLDRSVGAVVAPGEISPELTRAAVERGIPLYPRSRLVRSLGRSHVRGVELARRDGGGSFRLRCRTIVLAHRRLPNAQLAFQAGATRRWYDVPGAYYPDVDGLGRTAVRGLFVTGAGARPAGSPAPTADQLASAVLGHPAAVQVPEAMPGAPSEIVPYYRELLGEPRRGKWVICPCEDVLLEELERAVARGYRDLELCMRYTGVGTGLCQGRYCLPEAIALLAVVEQRPPSDIGFVTQRPPLVPTPLEALAAMSPEFDRGAPT